MLINGAIGLIWRSSSGQVTYSIPHSGTVQPAWFRLLGSGEGWWWLGLLQDHLVKGFLDITLAWKCLDGLETNSPYPLLKECSSLEYFCDKIPNPTMSLTAETEPISVRDGYTQ